MDLALLQKTLRQFAAEREWEPFHTPKNLAMALLVEAAELAEIFQWMTPEQSQAAHGDKVVQERIGEEVADVLLYLLQLADHSAVDLKRAVGRKLVKNAKKHPPLKPGLPAGPIAALEAPTHVLVDWENVQPHDADILALVPDVTQVWIFHGRQQRKVDANQKAFGDNLTLVPISRSGKNALDFHLSFYMGYITSRNPEARIVVLSNDQGYGPMLQHAQDLGFAASQLGFRKARSTARKTPARATRAAARTAAPQPEGAAVPVPDAAPAARMRTVTRRKPAAATAADAQPPNTATPSAANGTSTAAPAGPRRRGRSATTAAASGAAAAPVAPQGAASATPPAPAAAASARPRRSRKAAAPAATAEAKGIAPATATRGAGMDAAPGGVSDKDYAHIVKSLQKARDKPTRQARLLGMVRSHLPGGKADDGLVANVVARLVAEQRVRIDAKGAVTFIA